MEEDPELETIRKRKMEMLQKQMQEIAERSEYPDHPIEVTDITFNETVAKYPVVLIDFWAPWCGPCKMVTPVIERLSQEMHGKVVFAKLNVDDNPITTQTHKVMSIPTMMIFRNGTLVDRFVGAQGKSALTERLNRHMAQD